MVLPSCGEYKPINQVALLSSNPTKSVAISSRAAGASAEVDIPVSVKIHVWQSGTLTEPRPSPHRIWKAPPFHGAPPWRRIRETAGLPDVRLHDLRHAFASVAASAGMGLPIIGKMLGHTQAQTTQRYAHLASDPVKAAAAAVASKIAGAMKGSMHGDA